MKKIHRKLLYTTLAFLLALLLAACGADTAPELGAASSKDGPTKTLSQYLVGNNYSYSLGNGGGNRLVIRSTETIFVVSIPTAGNDATKVKIYGCKAGNDVFVSKNKNCEGQVKTNRDFYLFANSGSPAFGNAGRTPLYRCYNTARSDHFMRLGGCAVRNRSSVKSEGMLGYVRIR